MKNNENKSNRNNKNSKSEEAVKAYRPKYNDIKSDVSGSYTGVPENYEKPVQDADDL